MKGSDSNGAKRNELEATLAAELALFTRTTAYHRSTRGLLYTDGVKYLAGRTGTHWLIHAIASWQRRVAALPYERQVWELFVGEGGRALLTVRWGDGGPAFINHEIERTDFPLKYIKLYVQEGVIILPSERGE